MENAKFKVGDKVIYAGNFLGSPKETTSEETEVVAIYEDDDVFRYIVKYTLGWTGPFGKNIISGLKTGLDSTRYHYASADALKLIVELEPQVNNLYPIF